MKPCILIIINPAQIPGQKLGKDQIHAFYHFHAASEIPAQIDSLTTLPPPGIIVKLFHKQLRPCQPEFIDALFHIPHHKTIKMPRIFP